MQPLEKIRQELEKRQSELENRIKSINSDVCHHKQPLSNDWSEQAVERENDEVLEALGIASQRELGQIKVALNRISEGTYQNCSICTQPIPFERLRLVPQTTYCTSCASEKESTL